MGERPDIFYIALCIIAGYLVGNFETALLISRRKFREDIRRHGSGNAGTTNMIRVFGWRAGIGTFIGDFLKGILAVLIGRAIFGEIGGCIGGGFAVIGHCWPIFAGFRGGKGVATSLGIAFMVFPLGAVIAVAVAALLIWRFRIISLASVSGTAAFTASILFFRSFDLPKVVLGLVILVVVLLRHRDNLRRLIKHEEQPIR